MDAEPLDVVDRIVQRDDLQFAAIARPASTWRMASERPKSCRNLRLRFASDSFNGRLSRRRAVPDRGQTLLRSVQVRLYSADQQAPTDLRGQLEVPGDLNGLFRVLPRTRRRRRTAP